MTPNGMHWTTYKLVRDQADELDEVAWIARWAGFCGMLDENPILGGSTQPLCGELGEAGSRVVIRRLAYDRCNEALHGSHTTRF